jgi:Ser/Thr protein kinase RdoA (MazF antagonist)
LCSEQRVEVYPGYLYGMRDRFNKRIEFFRKITGDKKQTRISMENPLLNHFMLDYEQIKSTMKYLDKLFKDADPEFTHIHGDFTPNNLLVNNNNQIRVIDLEHTQLNWEIFDLSRFLNRLRNSTQNSNQNIENKIIEGYNTEFPITDKEAALIPYMRLHSRLYHLIGAVSRYYKYNDTHHLTDFKKQLAKAQIQISRIPELSDIQITVQ